jgi:hypothetical protein
MVADQRYCLNCGERRGQSRFSLEGMAAQVAPPPPPEPPKRAARRVPSGVTLITGVATLLLAMGVGVLIGHDSSNTAPARASQPVSVVTVGGSGGAATTTASTTRAPKTTKPQSNQAAAKAAGVSHPTVIKLTKKSLQAASTARTQQFGQGSSTSLPPPTIQPGQTCPANDQKGCTNGKFTGSFFGH